MMFDYKDTFFKGARISYSRRGAGPCIVLLHGFLESQKMWKDFVNDLTDSYTIITIDLPGFGGSGMIAEGHSMPIMAESVKHVLIEEKISKYVVVGHSMGGYIALNLAKLFPEGIQGILLFHSHASPDSEEVKHNRDRTIEIIKRDGIGFVSNFIRDLFEPTNLDRLSEVVEMGKEIARATKPEGVIAALLSMKEREGKLSFLTEMEIPLGIIAGKQDSRIPLQKILAQTALAKDLQLLMLDQVGHMGMYEEPKKCVQFLGSFVNYCQ